MTPDGRARSLRLLTIDGQGLGPGQGALQAILEGHALFGSAGGGDAGWAARRLRLGRCTLKVWAGRGPLMPTPRERRRRVPAVAVTLDGRPAVSGSRRPDARCLGFGAAGGPVAPEETTRDTNAEVVLVGDPASARRPRDPPCGGRLARDLSTDGMNVWPLELPPGSADLMCISIAGLAPGFRWAAGLPPDPPALYGRDSARADGVRSSEGKALSSLGPLERAPARAVKHVRRAARRGLSRLYLS